jgi:hypothetical protein
MSTLNSGIALASITVLLVVFPAACLAQLPWDQRLEDPRTDPRFQDYFFLPEFVDESPAMDEGFYESLRTLTLWRLAETLDLAEEDLVHLYPPFHNLEKAKQAYRDEKRILIDAVEEALASDDHKRIHNAMIEYFDARERFAKEGEKLEDKLLRVLTLEQQARYLIFMETVAPDIEAMLRGLHRLGH